MSDYSPVVPFYRHEKRRMMEKRIDEYATTQKELKELISILEKKILALSMKWEKVSVKKK